MPSDTVNDILQHLQKFYAKELNQAQLEFYRQRLAALHEDDLCVGVVAMKGKEPSHTFPTVNTIVRYFMEAKEGRLNQAKEKAPIFADVKRNQTTSHGRESIALMQDLYSGAITREQYLERIDEMENKYPGRGWKKNANELRAFWGIK